MLGFGATALLALPLAGQSTRAQVPVARIASVRLADDDGNQALFNSHDLAPGRTVTRCLKVDYPGSAAAGPVRFVATDVTGALAGHLTVRVAVGTGGGYAGCGGFSGTVFYTGTLAGLAGGTTDTPGVPTGWSPDPTTSRTFQMTVSVDPAVAQGDAASATFQWLLPAEPPPPPPSTSPSTSPSTAPSTAPAPAQVGGTAAPTPAATRAAPVPAAGHPSQPAKPRRKKPGGFAAAIRPEQVGQQVKKLIADSMVVGSRVVRHGGFPLGWLAVVGVFLLIQNRIDRRDPKLALAPVWSEPDVAFTDPANLVEETS